VGEVADGKSSDPSWGKIPNIKIQMTNKFENPDQQKNYCGK
jgi:hypothetical protein